MRAYSEVFHYGVMNVESAAAAVGHFCVSRLGSGFWFIEGLGRWCVAPL